MLCAVQSSDTDQKTAPQKLGAMSKEGRMVEVPTQTKWPALLDAAAKLRRQYAVARKYGFAVETEERQPGQTSDSDMYHELSSVLTYDDNSTKLLLPEDASSELFHCLREEKPLRMALLAAVEERVAQMLGTMEDQRAELEEHISKWCKLRGIVVPPVAILGDNFEVAGAAVTTVDRLLLQHRHHVAASVFLIGLQHLPPEVTLQEALSAANLPYQEGHAFRPIGDRVLNSSLPAFMHTISVFAGYLIEGSRS
jgi:hypothetical protein